MSYSRPNPQPFSSADIPDEEWEANAASWRAAQREKDLRVGAGRVDGDESVGSSDQTTALRIAEIPHPDWQRARAQQLAAANGGKVGGDRSEAERVPSAGGSDFDGAQAAGEFLGHVARSVGRFLQRQAVGSNGEPATSPNPAVHWAQEHEGGSGYTKFSRAADARGVRDDLQDVVGARGVGDPKCNQFVYDALEAAGNPPGRMDGGRIPIARDWGDPRSRIGGYSPVLGAPEAGDVVSDGEHVGIYAPLPDGSPGTISAASPWWLQGTGGWLGGVVHNDWGFRPGQRGKVTVWRATPRR